MSTPFPLEEQAQTQRAEPAWDPWKGQPAPTTFQGMGFSEDTAYLGPFYRALEAAGSGAAKGVAVLNGAWHGIWAPMADRAEKQGAPGASIVRYLEQRTAANEQDARERVKAMTPDPATTGSAVQLLHGVGEGAYLLSTGSLVGVPFAGAATVGLTEGGSRYQELREQGVNQETAAASGVLTGLTTGGGAVLPAAYGSTLATRLLTGAASNTGFGIANRYADHKILENGGYPEMAEQQKAWDASQMLVDAALGVTFGGIHHLQASHEARAAAALQTPANRDAALTANLALRDRAAAPGVPVDPAAAAAHQAAIEKATTDLLQGKPVDVSGTGVDRADFLRRPPSDITEPEDMLVGVLKESGILDEERNLQELEAALGRKMRGEPEPVQTPSKTSPKSALEQTTANDGIRYSYENGQHTVESANGFTDAVDVGPEGKDILVDTTVSNVKGRGEGTARMEHLAHVAHDRGGELISDHVVSAEQARVYESLARRGYDVRKNPDATQSSTTGGWMNDPGRPVFEVGPAPAQPARPAEGGRPPDLARTESVTSGSPPPDASAFVREFEQQNPQNPDEPAQRLVNGNVSVGLVTDPTNPNTAHIESVRALQTGGGAGSKAMEHIAALADQHGVRLTLHADPLDVAGIGSRKLVEWYKRFGFRITHSVGEGALMERPPGGAAEAELLPEPEELESVGAEHSLDNAYAVALTARAAQLEPDRVWQLAERHQADTPRFIRAIQAIVDEHEATHPSGGEGAQAPAAESGRATGRSTGGSQPGESAAVAAGVAGSDTTGTSPRRIVPESADASLTDDLGVASVGDLREQPRLQADSELRAGLEAMKNETGWAQVGGRVIRDPDTEQVTGRTSWIPNADWWSGRPKGLTEKQVHGAVDKALAGKPLSKREQAMIDFMIQVHDERVKMAETHADLREAVPDLAEQPREAVDLTVLTSRAAEHDAEAVGRVLDTWNDDHPETIARVRGELEQIIGRGQETLKAEADRGREPAQAQRAPAPGGDLFGQDTRATQALADETRRRDLLRSPNRDVSLETGRPDDLFSQSRRQIDIADTLADHADLQIAGENGKPTSAAAALHEADTAAAQGEQEAPKATEAAINCFLRKGA